MAKLQLDFPIKPCTVVQPFGTNYVNYQNLLGLKGHPGQDLCILDGSVGQWPQNPKSNIGYGKPIFSSCDGVVSSLEVDTNGGWTVVVVTDFFDYLDGMAQYKIVYAHCVPGSFRVKVGDTVKKGDILASLGSSGVHPHDDTPDPGLAHVHFGVKPCAEMPQSGDEPVWYRNLEQDNGYGGAIDNAPFWTGNFAQDSNPVVINNLKQQVSLYQKIVALLIQLKQLLNI